MSNIILFCIGIKVKRYIVFINRILNKIILTESTILNVSTCNLDKSTTIIPIKNEINESVNLIRR